MQIGIGGASGDQWGGTATHPASEVVSGVAADEDGNGTASVYAPADAIAGAAKYLIAHGVLQNTQSAIFAYNHADWYVEEVLSWASSYAQGGFTVDNGGPGNGAVVAAAAAGGQSCTQSGQLASFTAPNALVGEAVSYAQEQLGKPYVWGATGPAAFDCSGLVMMAYRTAGVTIPRTSQEEWKQLPHVPAGQVQPGDLVFFAGADGTAASPGHVGLIVDPAQHLMIDAYGAGTVVREETWGLPGSAPGLAVPVGFTDPAASP
jgi:cell wall-associated NlpC family hydrolase